MGMEVNIHVKKTGTILLWGVFSSKIVNLFIKLVAISVFEAI